MPERVIEVIPVIDLKGGAVGRARHGSRHSYAPIVTPLARTSAPLDVVAGLLTVHSFRTIYVADLDRIESHSSHDQSLDALSTAFPDVAFWVDAGVRDAWDARNPIDQPTIQDGRARFVWIACRWWGDPHRHGTFRVEPQIGHRAQIEVGPAPRATPQVGAAKARIVTAGEVARIRPELRFAYSRPGFLTFTQCGERSVG
jgi:hypothetical protein